LEAQIQLHHQEHKECLLVVQEVPIRMHKEFKTLLDMELAQYHHYQQELKAAVDQVQYQEQQLKQT